MEIEKPKFSIGDEVIHISKGSPKGFILDIEYTFSTKTFLYLVTFSCELASLWYFERELIKN